MTRQMTIDEAVTNRNGILALIVADPKVHAHIREVAAAIDANCQPGDLVSANVIRPYLPAWINTSVIGPAFGLLTRRGALEKVPTRVISTDPGTHGKDISVYRVLTAATEAVEAA